MSRILIALATLGLAIGAAHAQGDNSMNNAKAPGTTGAMKTPTAPGVATDPQQVQAQQGDAAKSSAGTVGAAPGADTQSQKPADNNKK
jgi:hypothetical protein